METVSFIHMADGTAEDYAFLAQHEAQYVKGLPSRIFEALEKLEHSFSGYKVSRLTHSLQSATRAVNDGRDDEYTVAALLHDIGDDLAPFSHSEMAAAILRPFVSEKLYWIIKTHGVFQMYYYAHLTGGNQHARDRYRDHPWFDEAVEFCERYDQNCFDPDYPTLPLEHFKPILENVLGREPVFGEAQQA